MYNLKGFVRIQPLVNNSFGVISSLGELSTHAMTFTKERGEYEDIAYQDLTFISFSSKRSDTGVTSVPPAYVDNILNVINHTYQYCKTATSSLTLGDILNHLINSFASTIQNIEAGSLVNSPTVKLPEWISWSAPGLGQNRIKIWLSDAAFIRQYDEYEIIVVPPIDNLDDLFREPGITGTALDNRTPGKTMEIIQNLKNNHPETVIRAETYKFTNPLVSTYNRQITWHVIVYGSAGDNTDIIKNDIVNHCLNNSSFTGNDWRNIVPDLFRTTEFIMVPDWLKYAIPNRTVQAGIYSPITTAYNAYAEIRAQYPNYPEEHIKDNLQVFNHPYRSLSISCFGGDDNIDSKYKLSDVFPDYTIFGTSSPDFNRMSKKTQEWSYMLQELLIIAEDTEQQTILPSNVRKMNRNGKLYIARTYENVQYLVLAKSNLI